MVNEASFKTSDNDILLLIGHLGKALKLEYDKKLANFDLTVQQARCLQFIAKHSLENNEVHQNDLEKRYELSKSTISGIIDRLEKKSLITRTNKGFYTILSPTNKGLSMINDIHQSRQEVIELLLKGFDEKRKIELKQTIEQLINNIKEDIQ